MDDEQLYLIEVLIDTIQFTAGVLEVPSVNDVTVRVKFGNFAIMDIGQGNVGRTFAPPNTMERRTMKLDMGKSYLFPMKSKELIKSLQTIPLEIEVQNSSTLHKELIGVVAIPWGAAFIEMVERSKTNGQHTDPAFKETDCDITNKTDGSISARIGIFVKLSCYGENIQTQFQVVERRGVEGEAFTKKYLFKTSAAEATFQAQKFGGEGPGDVIPVGPLFTPADPRLWQSPRGPFKPEDLSANKLNHVLCKNPDCPGAKKFKEFGLGPAATGLGLGTLYNQIDIPISYGMSHTYGALENYGPYGVYTRPKTLEQPFVPKQELSCATTPGCGTAPGCGCCGNCAIDEDSYTDENTACCSETDPPLRLCGGAPEETYLSESEEQDLASSPSATSLIYNIIQSNWNLLSECNPLRLYGGAPTGGCSGRPEPMAMCKDLMNSFDKVLTAYKTALGPCGQGSCPYASGMVEDACKKHCNHNQSCGGPSNVEFTDHTEMVHDPTLLSACGTPGCPFSRKKTTAVDQQFQLNQTKSACGSAQCPYARNKVGITDDEVTEFQLMDIPEVSRLCGGAKCPFPLPPCLPPLEPIHWDCPDPLPKGPCRNPQCPLKPKELRFAQIPKGPCGSPQCPYSKPLTCGDPNCPFGPPQPCPYQEQEIANDICDNPECPYAKPPASAAANSDSCKNPFRPQAQSQSSRPAYSPSQNAHSSSDICSNPSCPYQALNQQSSSDNASLCDNPQCPYASKQGSAGSGDLCENPDCPYVTKKSSPCYMPAQTVCGNPACPFAKRPPRPKPPPPPPPCAIPICDFPNCPFNPNTSSSPPCPPATPESRVSLCSIPNCPFSKKGGGAHVGTGDSSGRSSGSAKGPCTPDTCASSGGKQPCDECQQSGSGPKSTRSAPALSTKSSKNLNHGTASEKAMKSQAGGDQSKPKKKRCRGKYKYKLGDLYPGNFIGHRECIMPGHPVPAKMGWLWNVWTPCAGLRPRIGWRPGAVDRVVANRIIAHRKSKGLQLVEGLKGNPSKRSLKSKKSNMSTDSDATVAPKSTLQIKKRDGCYFITMNPLKEPGSYEDNENPYMDCTPMQFKITKNKDKKSEDDQMCFCDNDDPSSDSELDIEFTPPAGVIRPERLKRKKNVVHTDTQYAKEDFTPKEPKGKGKGEKGEKGGKGKKGKK